MANMLGKVSKPFKESEPLDRIPPNQSYNTTLKNYHNKIHTILSNAITADENSKF